MKFPFKVKTVDMETGGPYIIVLNKHDSEDLDVEDLERVKVFSGKKHITAIVNSTNHATKNGEIGTFIEVSAKLKLKDGQKVHLERVRKPQSVRIIKKKMAGKELTQKEFDMLIGDIMEENLTSGELSSFVTSAYIQKFTEKEIVSLTNSIVHSGNTLKLKKKPILDKHCIGGVPGNRTSMIIIPILAAAGLTIPKTSSRAITSPAGTADVMEVLCNIELDKKQVEEVVKKTNGCIVWGGGVGLAPADDKLIKVRNPLRIDPEGMLLASILAKKKAVNANYVLIDIPIGRQAKVATKAEAKKLANKFMKLGKALRMKVECIITPGYDPIGFAMGANLEAREILRILEGEEVSPDLREKSLSMAGILIQLGTKKRNGYKIASEILYSGKALRKLYEIIKAQGGKPVSSEDIKLAKYTYDFVSPKAGRIYYVNTQNVAAIAKHAGAPKDKKAGIYMYFEKGDKVHKGQKIMTIYAESKRKLDAAVESLKYYPPIEFEKIILDKFYSSKDFIHVKKR